MKNVKKKRSRFTIPLAALMIMASCHAQPQTEATETTDPAPQAGPTAQQAQTDTSSKLIQVVFALDATGSMSGLIATAKEKIWSIASSLSQAKSTKIEMGLVFYRDKGDAFITKVVPLSKDLDDVYQQLMSMTADGGGDGPESVNKGLYDAVVAMQWSKTPGTYKSVFLVGDCPPHMDYRNDVKYYETCKIASKMDIVLNTILMGENSETENIWRDIASCSQGAFMQVGMDANNIAVDTPYDREISELSEDMDKTRAYYGRDEIKVKNRSKAIQSVELKDAMSSATAARRAEYNATEAGAAGYFGEGELVSAYKSGKVDLDKLPLEQLPDTMKSMSSVQRKAYTEKLVQERAILEKKMKELVTKRQAYIEKEVVAKKGDEAKNSFDNKVYENIKQQAEKKSIKIEGKVKY